MHKSIAIDAARQFLSVAWEGSVPTDAALAAALDRLITAYHDTPDVDPSNDGMDAPRGNGPAYFQEVGARFPNYGLYPLADPADEPTAAMGMGDAIDDLGDIILDMQEVIWLADHADKADALWLFRSQFYHWGTHARDLARYLHGRQFG
jgi:hypothetical protein